MNPWMMGLVGATLIGFFGWTARRRWALLEVGAPTFESRFDDLMGRLEAVWTFAFWQKKMRYYLLAGLGHQLIFVGFVVLLLRTLVLWGRGFSPSFNLWILGPDTPLGMGYGAIKDVLAILVLIGVSVFVYLRVIVRAKRMTLSGEGLLILGIIATMMVSDIAYDAAILTLNSRYGEFCSASPSLPACYDVRDFIAPLDRSLQNQPLSFSVFEPAGTLVAGLLESSPLPLLLQIATVGFWTHATLVLVFLNILPYSKHFHIITAIPNTFLGDRTPKGRLRPLAKNTEDLMGLVEKASETEDMGAARIGYGRIEHFSWKDMVDFYTCTECGRCSDHCPAFTTGKKLSPKQLTLDLRNHLYSLQDEVAAGARPLRDAPEALGQPVLETRDLVPDVIDPDVLWACTTCRACEEQCPVSITYVDKIVQMRRNLVTIRGDFPAQLNKPFEGMETNGNPWNLSRMDRAKWTDGLDIPRAADHPSAPVLYWVGCAASYDDRAKRIARATAQLLQKAKVDFAILAEEESCTGDSARRAGNEYLFSQLAESNIETIKKYQDQGGIQKIVTTCPHCFNTLKNEYPDFGARFEVVHHSDFLLGLLVEGKLKPTAPVTGQVVFHDSCYLGRYNDIYDSPRELLRKIGVEVLEVPEHNRNKGLCCGAGGAQMWMEEQNDNRVNVKRTKELLATGAKTIAAGCPFCMTMLTDGIKAEAQEDSVEMLDIVELLGRACLARSASSLPPGALSRPPSAST
jgi:Fe-S oxidoreductase